MEKRRGVTKSRGFALNSEAYGRFRAWCEEHDISESATVNQAIEAYTGVEMPYRGPGRPAKTEVADGSTRGKGTPDSSSEHEPD